jgi:hypothetical protein
MDKKIWIVLAVGIVAIIVGLFYITQYGDCFGCNALVELNECETQMKTIAYNELVQRVGQEYFNEHYLLDKIDTEWGVVYYKFKFDDEISDMTLQVRFADQRFEEKYSHLIACKDVLLVEYIGGIDTLEINREEAREIAIENGVNPDKIVFYLQHIENEVHNTNNRPDALSVARYSLAWDMYEEDPCQTIRIDAITGEYIGEEIVHQCLHGEI